MIKETLEVTDLYSIGEDSFDSEREYKAFLLAFGYADGSKTYKEVESGLNRLKYRFTQVKGNGKITMILNDTSGEEKHYKFIC